MIVYRIRIIFLKTVSMLKKGIYFENQSTDLNDLFSFFPLYGLQIAKISPKLKEPGFIKRLLHQI